MRITVRRAKYQANFKLSFGSCLGLFPAVTIAMAPQGCFFSLLLELTIVAVALGVFVHGRRRELRTELWSIGGEQGWNSNPKLRIYFYANHREPPEIPFLWTERYVLVPSNYQNNLDEKEAADFC